MSNAKIRLKVGSMELEYEGDPAFLTGGIEALLETMGALASKVPDDAQMQAPAFVAPVVDGNGTVAPASGGSSVFSTNTIAAHIDAKTGPELVVCAMAQLELVQGKSSSTRAEILAEMKNATTYYKESLGSNLGQSLTSLTKKKRINQVAKDTYSLSSNERKQIEAKVAEIA